MVEKENNSEKIKGISNPFLVDTHFWSTWQGRIIRAIVLDHSSEKKIIAEVSKLDEKAFNKGYEELLARKFIEEKKDGKILTNRQLYCQCMSFFIEQQKALFNWAQEWRNQRRIDPIGRSNPSQFYLVGKSLYQFSGSLIEQAKHSILIANPIIKKCSISESLLEMSQKSVNVCILTRKIEPQHYNDELIAKGIKICEDESVHAKLIVVDDRVAIVSSMNFYSESSAETSWEAGVATMDKDIVMAISRSIIKKHNDILIARQIT